MKEFLRATRPLSLLIIGLAFVTGRPAPARAQLPPVPTPPQNPITESKRVLGKILFWEEQLSSDNTVACGTCHRPEHAGADPRLAINPGLDKLFNTPDDVHGSFGVARADVNGVYIPDPVFGMNPQVTPRSAQIVIGSQWSPLNFWDGRAGPQFVDPQTGIVVIPVGGGLEAQSVNPIVSDVEMAKENRDWTMVTGKLAAATPLAVAEDLPPDVSAAISASPTYPDLFQAAFGDPNITATRIAFAIATYERTLVADQTPWDAFVGGNPGALTPGQAAGWNFFRGSQCAICHAPPLFTDNTFRNIGLRPIPEDTGRQGVTGAPADAGRFKVPSLRNTGLKTSYMHNGRLQSLNQVLDFYLGINGQVQFPQNQDPLIPPIAIPPQVRPALIDFLQNGLTDPRVAAEQFPFDRPTLRSEIVVGDFDGDGDVDGADFAIFSQCFGGSLNPPAATCPPGVNADLDGDGDVDTQDFVLFSQNYTGAL